MAFIRDSMKLTVIIPMYNREATIADTLHSILGQPPVAFSYEVILVDDGSTDGTVAICKKIADVHPQVRIVQQPNGGPGAARNTGLEQANGDYVWFVDSDDWLCEDAFLRLEPLLEKKSDIIAFAAADATTEGDRRRLSYRELDGQVVSGRDFLKKRIRVSFLSYSFRFSVSIPCSAFRRDFLMAHQLRMLPEIYHEDFEFMPRVYYHAQQIAVTDTVLYRVRLTPGSIVRSVSSKRALDYLAVTRSLASFSLRQVCCRRQLCVAVGVAFCNALDEICRTDNPSDDCFQTILRQGRGVWILSLFCSWNLKLMLLAVLAACCPFWLPQIYNKIFR